ncbi:MAG: ABC transporter ATP-binding protein [Planctomycetota bacterium]|jgi:putative ABC transport system ATP-binding protein
MPSGTILLEARNIARRHPDGRRWLLQNVSLEIPAAARLSIAGPSGSGKTLLLRALAMLDPSDRGEVLWNGRPVRRDGVPPFRKAVVYLHQRPALWEETVEAALRRPFSLAVHRGQEFDRDRIAKLLEQLGRDQSFLNKRTAELSGGELQIASLLRAVQLDPTVLLLDEPTAALDLGTARAVEELLRRWVADSSDERALLWVTHDAQQARRVAQKTFRMDGGKLEE